jgi:hypothetical protein
MERPKAADHDFDEDKWAEALIKWRDGVAAARDGDSRTRLDQRWPDVQKSRLELWADRRGLTMSAAILTIVADRLDADEVRK